MANNQQLLLGEGAGSAPAVYIEDVFSTYLYASTSGTDNQVINGIDLSTKSGLVWSKSRTRASTNHYLIDTVRGSSSGNTNALVSNTTAAQSSGPNLDYLVFNSNGYTAKAVVGGGELGTNTYYGDLVSWTFRKQPKFFDVVTYTGNGAGAGQTINHNLGSIPGFIICKSTSTTGDWAVCARTGGASSPASSITYSTGLSLNSTGAALYSGTLGDFPTATTFSTAGIFDNPGNYPNVNGVTYVAYLFAHDAGGFGLAGTDNVISCGSYTDTGSGTQTITLGYEPQWVMRKRTNSADNWTIVDNMRGLTSYSSAAGLNANSSGAEFNFNSAGITATGFEWATSGSADTFIYIAIRRGPMKVPTVGTSVFSPQALNAPANGTQVTTGFPIDLSMFKPRDGGPSGQFQDRLRGLPSTAGGGTPALYPDATAAESTNQTGYEFWNTGYRTYTSQNAVWWMLRRAPGFFDVVCYTGTGANTTQTHNLGISPQLVIVKARSDAGTNWLVFPSTTSFGNALYLNTTTAFIGSGPVSALSSTTVTFNYHGNPSYSASTSATTYVAYLFATCAGVSKVGSYTGNGSSQTIACGFTAGSRFVMIKRTDSTGDWYVWDSARGIVAGNDPHLSLNTTAAEVTTDDSVDTDNSGFIVNQLSATDVNVSSASYIFLAVS